jgi:sulfur relay (sulfurtransferase) complex TusBCD TusD component (DsrE family)
MPIIVQITKPPFGQENTFAGLYVASASLSKGLEVIVILMGDGVYAAEKGQIDPQRNIFLPPTETQLSDIVELGGRVIVDRNALYERGIEDGKLIGGLEVKEMGEIQNVILDHGDKVVAF